MTATTNHGANTMSIKKEIYRAISEWQGAYWPHMNKEKECMDDPDCTTCRMAMIDAQTAKLHGLDALRYLADGDTASARAHVQTAVNIEKNWGESSIWGPILDQLGTTKEEENDYGYN